MGLSRVFQGFQPQGGQQIGERRVRFAAPGAQGRRGSFADLFVPPDDQAVEQQRRRGRAAGRRPGAVLRLFDPQMLFGVVERDFDRPPPRVSPEDRFHVGFDVGGQHVGLLPNGGPQGFTSPVAYWEVADIEAKLAEITAAGGTVREPVQEVGGGRRVATVTDADGNVLGLLQDR